MAIFSGPEIVNSGLVLHLDAANLRSYSGTGTSWYDLSGNNNTGTLTNGPTYDSLNKGNLVFDGTNDLVTTSTLPYQFLTTGVTISVIIKYSQTTTNDNVISWGTSAFNGGPNYSWEIRIRGSGSVEFSPGVVVSGTVPTKMTYAQSTPLNNRDAFLDVVYTANGMSYIYENAVQVASYNYTGVGVYTNTQSLRIGRGTDSNFPGKIYSVKLYNRPLSQIEVKQNFTALRGRYGI